MDAENRLKQRIEKKRSEIKNKLKTANRKGAKKK